MASKSFFRSILSNWAGIIITGVISFVLVPILIRGLGDFQYGIWALVISVVDSYGLLDTGIRVTLQRFVAHTTGQDERAALNEIFSTAMGLLLLISIMLILATAALVIVLPGFVHVTGLSRPLFRWVTALVGLSMVVTLPNRGLATYLIGLQRFDLYNLGNVLSAACRALLIVAVLHWGYGLLGVAAVVLAVTLGSVPFYCLLLRQADPGLSFRPSRFNWQRARELGRFSLYAYLNSGGDYIRFFTDNLVTGRVLSLAMITMLNPVERIMAYFQRILGGLAGPFTPRLSELEGCGRQAEVQEVFLRGTRACALLSIFLGSMIALDGRTVLRLWLGERFVAAYPLLLVLAVGYIAYMSQLPSQSLMFAKARHKALGCWAVGEGLLNLALSVYWARHYGLLGIVLGTTVPMLITALLIQPWYTLRLVGMSITDYVARAFARPLLVAAVFLLSARVSISWQADANVFIFGAIVMAQSMVFILLSYAIGFSDTDRSQVRDWFRRFARLRVNAEKTAAALRP